VSSNVSDVRLSKHVIARELSISSSGITADLGILCLIAVLGLTITALVFTFGFGPDVTQALGMSG
jgi:hypothetical protein